MFNSRIQISLFVIYTCINMYGNIEVKATKYNVLKIVDMLVNKNDFFIEKEKK